MAVRLSALRISRTLLPRNIIILMFLVLISVRGWVNPSNYTEVTPVFYSFRVFNESSKRPCIVHAPPISYSLLSLRSECKWRSSLLCNFFPFTCYFRSLGSQICFSVPFPQIYWKCLPLKIRESVWYRNVDHITCIPFQMEAVRSVGNKEISSSINPRQRLRFSEWECMHSWDTFFVIVLYQNA
jgi:hypothetical protein